MAYNELKDKVPPHNLEAEQATLGALLLNFDAISNVVSLLDSEKFYSYQNKLIYEAMISLFRQNIHGDTLSLINELTKTGKLEEAGGAAYIASLTDLVPTAANVEYYAKIVLDQSTRRELIRISQELKAASYNETKESRGIIEEAEKLIFTLSDKNQTTKVYNMKEIINDTINAVEEHYKNKSTFTGIPTGFAKLDTMTSGFQNSELIILGARPSIGKTAMALSMMEYIAVDQKIPCGFFSLEMSALMLGQRLLSQTARVPGGKLKSGMLRIEDFQKLQQAASRCYEAPLYIIDVPNMPLLDLKAMARRLVVNQGVKIIFIDYIGLISTDNPNTQVWEQVSEISKSLKALARELAIPIVALCQVSRDAEGEEPTLNQLRGSGSIEQDADVVMFLHRERRKTAEQEENPVQDAKLIVAKQRNGPTGDVDILYLSSYTKFENKAQEN
ncbi:MAG: replicative DNA helicase [Treponema sp.]|uniref:replicative DNA helicase n=1 Tax=Treponema sp. TaxID=166 RepID=UPI001DE894A8|nr:replicative DNA helicase [Treponema sp.]MBS7310329.1 replicative DNA helicase [Treponema sp.]MCI5696422.1 replicative DNA helicase [Spirochaetia bacterium]MDD5811675.1 replicative DNA helicase [Treponema sp.]MDY5885444.1 replicative DNA helicase [Treponema sp.]